MATELANQDRRTPTREYDMSRALPGQVVRVSTRSSTWCFVTIQGTRAQRTTIQGVSITTTNRKHYPPLPENVVMDRYLRLGAPIYFGSRGSHTGDIERVTVNGQVVIG